MKGVAAGAAAVFVITMTGGPGIAVTSAAPGALRLGSSTGHDGGHAREGSGHWSRARNGDRHVDGLRVNGRRDDGRRDDNRPGSGRDRGSAGQSTGRATGVTASRGSSSVATVQPATTSRAVTASVSPAVTPADVSPGGAAGISPAITPIAPIATTGGSGATFADTGAATSPFEVPRAVFGDGRSPAFGPEHPAALSGEPVAGQTISELPVTYPAQPPAVASLVEAPPAVPARVSTMRSVPWPLSDTPMTSIMRHVQPGWPAGLLFGIAGLLLAPIGGIWLGHRQARAAKAASQLVAH
jgi:hypothetical protein